DVATGCLLGLGGVPSSSTLDRWQISPPGGWFAYCQVLNIRVAKAAGFLIQQSTNVGQRVTARIQQVEFCGCEQSFLDFRRGYPSAQRATDEAAITAFAAISLA